MMAVSKNIQKSLWSTWITSAARQPSKASRRFSMHCDPIPPQETIRTETFAISFVEVLLKLKLAQLSDVSVQARA